MNLGMPEMIFIFLLALVVVGPKRLPELARQLGKWAAEFKRASNEFKNQLETEMMNIELDERARKQTEAGQGVTAREAVGAGHPAPGLGSLAAAAPMRSLNPKLTPHPRNSRPHASVNESPTPVRSTPDA